VRLNLPVLLDGFAMVQLRLGGAAKALAIRAAQSPWSRDEMPLLERRQVCVGRREAGQAWLLYAYSGHAGAVAAIRRDQLWTPASPLLWSVVRQVVSGVLVVAV
jgi:hypothetical protein